MRWKENSEVGSSQPGNQVPSPVPPAPTSHRSWSKSRSFMRSQIAIVDLQNGHNKSAMITVALPIAIAYCHCLLPLPIAIAYCYCLLSLPIVVADCHNAYCRCPPY